MVIAAEQHILDSAADFNGLLAWCKQMEPRELIKARSEDLYKELGLDDNNNAPSLGEVLSWAVSHPEMFALLKEVEDMYENVVDSESRLREQREKEDRDMLKRRAEAEEQRRIRELEKWKQANQNRAD